MSNDSGPELPDDSVTIRQLWDSLSTRAVNVLGNLGVRTVGQYRALAPDDLFYAHNCGKVTRDEIEGVLGPLGSRDDVKIEKLIPVSLRDWFAGMAVQGELAHYGNDGDFAKCARYAYEAADAMIAERERKP